MFLPKVSSYRKKFGKTKHVFLIKYDELLEKYHGTWNDIK